MLAFQWSLVATEGKYERQGAFWVSTHAGDFPCKGWKEYPLTNMIFITGQVRDQITTPSITKRYISFRPYYLR